MLRTIHVNDGDAVHIVHNGSNKLILDKRVRDGELIEATHPPITGVIKAIDPADRMRNRPRIALDNEAHGVIPDKN